MTLRSIPATPVPDHVVSGLIKTPDGAELRFARWQPPAGRKGTVCVFTGRGECIEKYFETVRDLRARGFAVAMIDWRGQGHSSRQLRDPRRGYVRNFSDFEIDVETFVQQVVLPDCPPPYFVLGHSMGGAVAIRACHDGRRWFERIVLSAPMLALPPRRYGGMAAPMARLMRWLGRGGAYIPGGDQQPSGPEDFIGNVLTSDPVRFARNLAILAEEPELALGPPTIAWADAALRQMRDFSDPSYAAHIRQPMLLVAAGYDQVVWTPAIEDFGMYLLAGRHLILPGARHEILQEQDQFRAQFWAAFDAFVPGTPRY